MLDDLIRAALKEAAEQCVVPETVSQNLWGRIIQSDDPGPGGISNEQ